MQQKTSTRDPMPPVTMKRARKLHREWRDHVADEEFVSFRKFIRSTSIRTATGKLKQILNVVGMAVLLLLGACDVPAPVQTVPAPPVQRPRLSREQQQLQHCKHTCESQGLAVARASTGERPTCECGQAPEGVGVGDGVELGIGMEIGREVGRQATRHVLRELF